MSSLSRSCGLAGSDMVCCCCLSACCVSNSCCLEVMRICSQSCMACWSCGVWLVAFIRSCVIFATCASCWSRRCFALARFSVACVTVGGGGCGLGLACSSCVRIVDMVFSDASWSGACVQASSFASVAISCWIFGMSDILLLDFCCCGGGSCWSCCGVACRGVSPVGSGCRSLSQDIGPDLGD